MDIKKNGFLIGIAAGLAVAVIGFAVLVVPAWSAASAKSTSIQGSYGTTLGQIAAKQDVPTQQWVDQMAKHKDEVLKNTKDIFGYFQKSDAALEEWFDGKEPQRGVLFSRAGDGIRDMLKELRDAKLDYVPADGRAKYGEANLQGFEFQDSAAVGDDRESKLEWQRKYNIHVKVKNALLEAHAKAFYKVQYSKVAGPVEIATRQDFRPITNNLGQTIPFVVEASFLWKDVPAFLAALLRYDDAKPSPMFRIVITSIDRDPNPLYKVEATREEEIGEDEFKAAGGAAGWKPKNPATESPVKVTLLVEAYNFAFTENQTNPK